MEPASPRKSQAHPQRQSEGQQQTEGRLREGGENPLRARKWEEPEKGKEGRERKEQGKSPGVEGGYHQGCASPFEITVINKLSQGQAKGKSLWPKAR